MTGLVVQRNPGRTGNAKVGGSSPCRVHGFLIPTIYIFEVRCRIQFKIYNIPLTAGVGWRSA